MRSLRKVFVSAVATVFVATAFGAPAEEKAVPATASQTLISGSGLKIEMPWSKRWSQIKDPKFRPDTVGLSIDGDTHAMSVMISVAGPIADGNMADARMLEIMQDTIKDLSPQAVEQDLAPIELKGGKHHAWYFIATDKAPKAEEYKYISQVMVAAGDAFVFSTILFNDVGLKDVQQVREALANAVVTFP